MVEKSICRTSDDREHQFRLVSIRLVQSEIELKMANRVRLPREKPLSNGAGNDQILDSEANLRDPHRGKDVVPSNNLKRSIEVICERGL